MCQPLSHCDCALRLRCVAPDLDVLDWLVVVVSLGLLVVGAGVSEFTAAAPVVRRRRHWCSAQVVSSISFWVAAICSVKVSRCKENAAAVAEARRGSDRGRLAKVRGAVAGFERCCSVGPPCVGDDMSG